MAPFYRASNQALSQLLIHGMGRKTRRLRVQEEEEEEERESLVHAWPLLPFLWVLLFLVFSSAPAPHQAPPISSNQSPHAARRCFVCVKILGVEYVCTTTLVQTFISLVDPLIFFMLLLVFYFHAK
jgi:hypothetical protein